MKLQCTTFLLRGLTLALCLAVWEWVSRITPNQLFPPPSAVWAALGNMIARGELQQDLVSSLRRSIIGYAMGCLLGIWFGVLTGRLNTADSTLGAVIQVLRPIPVIAIAPFAALWLGLGEMSKVAVVSFGVFFPVWLNTHLGVRQVHPHYLWVAASVGAARLQTFFHVLLPAAASHVIAGMRTAIATAFICLVAAEMSGASSGLGYRVEASHLMYQVDRMVASLVVLGTLGALADVGFAWLVKQIAPWYGAATSAH